MLHQNLHFVHVLAGLSGLGLEPSDREKFSGIQGEVLAII